MWSKSDRPGHRARRSPIPGACMSHEVVHVVLGLVLLGTWLQADLRATTIVSSNFKGRSSSPRIAWPAPSFRE